MARYPSTRSRRRRNRTQRWVYGISALFIIGVLYSVYHIAQRYTARQSRPIPNNLNVANIEIEPRLELIPEPNLSEIRESSVEPNPKVAELIDEAMAFLNTEPSNIIRARYTLNEALAMPQSSQQRTFVKQKLSELADKWLFSKTVFPEDRLCSNYEVKPGEQLINIGNQFKVPYEILMEINNIPRAEDLQAGQTIKVINGPFHARVYRSTLTMDLYLQNTFVRSFPVGLGRAGRETPIGLWVVKEDGKLISPTWTDPDTLKTYRSGDSDYPLGSRWIGLEGIAGDAKDRTGFAIHGTKKPEEIGTAGSRGCIRLHNGDAILVYNLLVPSFSRVEVVE